VFLVSYFFFGLDEILQMRLLGGNDIEIRREFLIARGNIRDLSLTIWIIYSLIADASRFQGTLGKKVMKIKVVSEDGARISIRRSMARNLFKIISAIPIYLGFIWILFNKKRRGWHDMVAKTYVIETSALKSDRDGSL
jgi:uncharacterized RDD family membrane protein YckC